MDFLSIRCLISFKTLYAEFWLVHVVYGAQVPMGRSLDRSQIRSHLETDRNSFSFRHRNRLFSKVSAIYVFGRKWNFYFRFFRFRPKTAQIFGHRPKQSLKCQGNFIFGAVFVFGRKRKTRFRSVSNNYKRNFFDIAFSAAEIGQHLTK